MGAVLTDIGEEYIMDLVENSGATLIIGFYADDAGPGTPSTTDTISDGDDLSDISTEPTGSGYSRQTESVSNATVDLSGSDALLDIPTQNFDVSDSSRKVNGFFIGINFDSDEAGDAGTPVDHLIWTGHLSSVVDLSSESGNLELKEAGGTLS